MPTLRIATTAPGISILLPPVATIEPPCSRSDEVLLVHELMSYGGLSASGTVCFLNTMCKFFVAGRGLTELATL